MKIDRDKAAMIFGLLLGAYIRKEHPYNKPEAELPQAEKNLPKELERGSREHALFLFAACYWMRGGIKSDTAVRQLTKLYEMRKDVFLPDSSVTAAELVPMLDSVGLGFNAKEIASSWKRNMSRIAQDWNGDPRTLFAGIKTYEEACARIQNKKGTGFLGFQEKMVSMLTYFYMDAGIVDRWNFPIPVDFHVLRTVFSHEIIVVPTDEANSNGFYTRTVLAAVRELFHSYCVDHQVDPLLLCEAVWLYSGTMCNQHPGNQSRVPKKRNGRKTKITPMHRWSFAQSQAYSKTCEICVIQNTCIWCIPSAEYYIGGKIVLRSRRDAPNLLF